MIQKWFKSTLVIVAFAAGLHGQERQSLIQSVKALPGWNAVGSSDTFDESRIDTFDPKLAPGLRAYDINGITVQTWRSPVGQVKATLFQFQDASPAYGFFTIRRKAGTSSADSSGTESFQSGSVRYFWQARYVVRLEGDPRAMDVIARTLSENILGRSQRPPISSHLPSRNLVAGSEAYILDAVNIQKLEGVDPSAIGFDLSAEAASADYRVNDQRLHLLLMRYPTQQLAKKYSDQMDSASPESAASRKRIGVFLAIVSGSSDATIIQALLDQVHYASVVTWNEPQPGLGLGPVIVTVFTFIAILLGVCIVVGISLGGIRILTKTFFPNRVFDRPESAEFIQLKLDQALIRKELGE